MNGINWQIVAGLGAAFVVWIIPAGIVAWALIRAARRYDRGATDDELMSAYKAGYCDSLAEGTRGEGQGVIRLPKDPQAAHDLLLALALKMVDMAEEIQPAAGGNGSGE